MSLDRTGLINCMSASTPGLTPEKMLTDGLLMKRLAEEHHDTWDELMSIQTLSYNSRPQRTTGVAPYDWVTPRHMSHFSLKRMPDVLTPNQSQSVVESKETLLQSLTVLLPHAQDSIAKPQAQSSAVVPQEKFWFLLGDTLATHSGRVSPTCRAGGLTVSGTGAP